MLKKLSGYTLALIGLTLLFSSCKKEYQSIESLDEQNIEDYISKNNITAIKDSSGFYYQIIDKGSGEAVTNPDSVYYSYDFKHTSNVTVVKSTDYSIPYSLLGYTDRFTFGGVGYLIAPIRLVLSQLNRGGTAKVIIPSRMLFGKNGNTITGVGSNEVIVVDLKLFAESKQWQIDELEINKFIADNSLQMIKDSSRVRYNIATPGTGTEAITADSKLTINYTGRLLDGTVFDSSTDGTFVTTLSDVIKGWGDVLPKLTKGAKIRMLIPSDRAYGSSGSSAISPNSTLDFDIEIVDVSNE